MVDSDIVVMTVRTRKEDSAFVYAVLEAHEGIASYSTLDHPAGAPFRDLRLVIPAAFEQEVDQVLRDLGGIIVSSARQGSES